MFYTPTIDEVRYCAEQLCSYGQTIQNANGKVSSDQVRVMIRNLNGELVCGGDVTRLAESLYGPSVNGYYEVK